LLDFVVELPYLALQRVYDHLQVMLGLCVVNIIFASRGDELLQNFQVLMYFRTACFNGYEGTAERSIIKSIKSLGKR